MKKMSKFFEGLLRMFIVFFVWMYDKAILLKPFLKQTVKFVSVWNELLTIPLGFAMFYFFPLLLRMIDPVAGAYDIGILHTAIAAIAIMLIIHGFVWVILKITFPGIYKFLDDALEIHINKSESLQSTPTDRDKIFLLTTYQKCVISLSLFSLYLLGTILLVRIF